MKLPIKYEDIEKDVLAPEDPLKKFEVNCKSFFLTFSQLEEIPALDVFMEKVKVLLQTKGRNVLKIICCLEEHQDEGKHIHCLFELDKSLHLKDSKFFDGLTGQHPNIGRTRKIQRAVLYVAKDGNYLSEGYDVNSIEKTQISKKGVETETIVLDLEKRSLKEVIEDNKSFAFKHLRQMKEYKAQIEMYAIADNPKLKWNGVTSEQSQCLRLVKWINKNILKPRRPKQPQLWLYGDGGLGKTPIWRDHLEKFCRVYQPAYEKWNDGYQDKTYDLIVYDEYQGGQCLTLGFMNQMLEGSPMQLIRRNLPPYRKLDNLPVMIISNEHPSVVYREAKEKNSQVFEAFLGRLEVVHVTKKIKLEFKYVEEEETQLITLTPPSPQSQPSPDFQPDQDREPEEHSQISNEEYEKSMNTYLNNLPDEIRKGMAYAHEDRHSLDKDTGFRVSQYIDKEKAKEKQLKRKSVPTKDLPKIDRINKRLKLKGKISEVEENNEKWFKKITKN